MQSFIGNDNIAALTNQRNYMLRIDLGDWEGEWRYAIYSSFKVDDAANKYKLIISGFSGDAGMSVLTQ